MEFEEPPSHAEARENEKNISEYADDAEEAVMNMIQDHMVENLNDPDIWHLVNGFMDRMVRLLSHLEDLHEDTKAKALGQGHDEHGEEDQNGEDHNGDAGDMLDELRDGVDEDEHNHGDEYGNDYGEEGYGDEEYDHQGEGYDHQRDDYDHDRNGYDNEQYDHDHDNDNDNFGDNHNQHC